MGSKVVLATTIAFFRVFIGTVAALRAAEQGRLDVLRALGASRLQMFRMVALPDEEAFAWAEKALQRNPFAGVMRARDRNPSRRGSIAWQRTAT